MIAMSTQFLALIGFTADEAYDLLLTARGGDGLAISALFSFGGAGNGGHDRDALAAEPEPRTLLLVGMGDRYGGGQHLATVREICTEGHGARRPTAEEREEILAALAACAHPTAAAIAARLRGAE